MSSWAGWVFLGSIGLSLGFLAWSVRPRVRFTPLVRRRAFEGVKVPASLPEDL